MSYFQVQEPVVISELAAKKMDCHNRLVKKLTELLANESINMTIYTFMINYIKLKGPLTSSQQYYEIINNILLKCNDEDKKEIIDCIECLFAHIYDLFGNTGVTNYNDVNITKIVNDMENYTDEKFAFTDDQKIAVKELCYFLYNNSEKTFGLYGYAGTGKTTIITKFINYMLLKNYISSVVLSAPTNVAVNMLKSKFRADMEPLVKNKLRKPIVNFENTLDELVDKGITIKFLTIHRLLDYKNDFDVDGDRVFIKGSNCMVSNFDLVIVDECSMVSMQIAYNIYQDINKPNLKKIPNVVFLGDPCQINPVKEASIVFAKKDNEFSFPLFQKAFLNTESNSVYGKDNNTIKQKFEEFKHRVMAMRSTTLKQVMRTKNPQVVGLCNEVRKAVLREIKIPMFNKFKSNKIFLYKYDPNIKKIDSIWFKKVIQYSQEKEINNQHVGNNILTWTNNQSDEYNKVLRQIIHNKNVLNKYEPNDVLILKDFYNTKDANDTDNNKVFYTSEQIKILQVDKTIKAILPFVEQLEPVDGLSNFLDVKEKYIRNIKNINKNTIRKYNSWKLSTIKIDDIINNKLDKKYIIYDCEDSSLEVLKADKLYVTERIKELRNYYNGMHKENMNIIDHHIIKKLWKEYNQKLIEPFADISYSLAISTHKSQCATLHNGFIDVDDIFKNTNLDEALKLLYTAFTRFSNELHIFI